MKTIVVLLFFAIAQSLLSVSSLELSSHDEGRHNSAFHKSTLSHANIVTIDETTLEEDSSGEILEPAHHPFAGKQTPLKKDAIFVISTKLSFISDFLRYISLLSTSPPQNLLV